MDESRSMRSTLDLAHTARCKLRLAADRPDRNLRFILGHAFTLDKLMLRVVEIENSRVDFSDHEDDEEEAEDDAGIKREVCTAGVIRRREKDNTDNTKIKFRSSQVPSLRDPVVAPKDRKRSPPPIPVIVGQDEEDDGSSDEEDDDDEEDEEDNGLSLRRFASGTSRPPRMIPPRDPASENHDADGENASSSSDDEDEPKSPPLLPETAIQQITSGEENGEFKELYDGVAGCPCHGKDGHAPIVTRAWDVPREMLGMEKGSKGGIEERVIALVQVEA